MLSYNSPQALLHACLFLYISPFSFHLVPFSLICLPDYCIFLQLLVLQLPAPLQRPLRLEGISQSQSGDLPGRVCPSGHSMQHLKWKITQYFTLIFPVTGISRRSTCPLHSLHYSWLLCSSHFFCHLRQNFSILMTSPLL